MKLYYQVFLFLWRGLVCSFCGCVFPLIEKMWKCLLAEIPLARLACVDGVINVCCSAFGMNFKICWHMRNACYTFIISWNWLRSIKLCRFRTLVNESSLVICNIFINSEMSVRRDDLWSVLSAPFFPEYVDISSLLFCWWDCFHTEG